MQPRADHWPRRQIPESANCQPTFCQARAYSIHHTVLSQSVIGCYTNIAHLGSQQEPHWARPIQYDKYGPYIMMMVFWHCQAGDDEFSKTNMAGFEKHTVCLGSTATAEALDSFGGLRQGPASQGRCCWPYSKNSCSCGCRGCHP